MEEWLVYVIRMIACSALFFAYFAIALRGRRFHRFNRFYLLFSVVVSLLMPLLHIPLPTVDGTPAIGYLQQLDAVIISPLQIKTASINWALTVYATISMLIFIVNFISVARIGWIKRKYPSGIVDGVTVYFTDEPNAPFTFLRSVFWKRGLDINSGKGQIIFLHERAHATEGHSQDLLFMKLVLSLAWVNPFFHFMYQELLAVHEFEADEQATGGSDKEIYSETLVREALQQRSGSGRAHQFYHSPLKRRIHMLLNSSIDRFSQLRKWLVIPVSLFVLALLAFRSEIAEKNNKVQSFAVASAQQGDHDAQFPGGAKAWQEYLIKNLRYPLAAQDAEIQGLVLTEFTVDEKGNTSGFKVVKGPEKGGLREEALRMLQASGNWIPAVRDGKNVQSVKQQPIIFRLETEPRK